ncbi:MAG: undecaprenyl-phosphate glucose phosphotransferase [Geminicoccaceae bacterium]
MLTRPPQPPVRPSLPAAAPQSYAWREAQAAARALAPRSDPRRLVAEGLRLGDVLIVLLASALAYLIRHGPIAPPLEITSTTLLAAAMAFQLFWQLRIYDERRAPGLVERIGKVAQGWSLLIGAMVLLGYLTKTSEAFSRTWLILWYCLALAGFVGTRLLAASWLSRSRQRGGLARTVAVVDLDGRGVELVAQLRGREQDVRLVGIFSVDRTPARMSAVEDLLALSRLFRIDEVLVSTSGGQEVDGLVRRLGAIPAHIRLCPNLPKLAVPPRAFGLVLGQPMLTVLERPLTGWNSIAKRMEDLVLGALLLVALTPLMLLVALLVRLDSPGPVLFRQQRLGFNNNVIDVLKFRSMFDRPPAVVAAETEVPQARRDDPRVTRVGYWLRRTSIDELPQLLNVLRGEMSLVGPRPHALRHNEHYAALIDDYLGRHRVQPGITGWAQIHGLRGETETLEKMRSRVEHDLAYINNWSILLDLKILLLTPVLVLFHRNAY